MGALGIPEEGANSGKSLERIVYTEDKKRQMEKLISMRDTRIRLFMQIELLACRDELDG